MPRGPHRAAYMAAYMRKRRAAHAKAKQDEAHQELHRALAEAIALGEAPATKARLRKVVERLMTEAPFKAVMGKTRAVKGPARKVAAQKIKAKKRGRAAP